MVAALVVIAGSLAVGVLRPRTRDTAGAIAAIAAIAATVASVVAVFIVGIVAPGPVLAVAAAPLVFVASSVGSRAAVDG